MPEQTEPTGAESPRERANRAQLDASDPAVSVFVAASAGSGKTKLLTDRLLRLMVGGAKPERILCLTFTKAAAAEMALRLQRRLGEWVTLDDRALNAELRKLCIDPSETAIRFSKQLLYWGFHIFENSKPQLAFRTVGRYSYPRMDFLKVVDYLELQTSFQTAKTNGTSAI